MPSRRRHLVGSRSTVWPVLRTPRGPFFTPHGCLPTPPRKLCDYPWLKINYGVCYGLNVCVPRNSNVEALTPKVMAFGGGASGGD